MGARSTFAKKITSLRGKRSYRAFSNDIKEQTGKYISFTALKSYEEPEGKEPRFENIDTLAEYAHVSPAWFFDSGEKIDSKEHLSFLLREEGLNSTDIAIISEQMHAFIEYAKKKK